MGAWVHRELGLTDDELDSIVRRLGRDPTYTELAMFSVMWSEHCSYKSSRKHLATLPSRGDHIIIGPGEGAGVVEVVPGVAVAWKVESHNHPSYVEPGNGAATGVGGIVRDILSMGARPIALLDSLRFGAPGDAHTNYLIDGVVGGISSYGNAIGVPTVGGEAVFDSCYAQNPLVNVACLGIVEGELQQGRAEGPGNVFVLIGSSTGRDGIGGASVLASAEFDAGSSEKRPAVQVGDPLAEKLLIEGCLELAGRGLLVGFQDLGAGGISCPVAEMTSKAGTGAVVDLDQVHRREPGMAPFEVMISESQERMLAVVDPADVDEVLAICERWELVGRVIGVVTPTGRVVVEDGGEVVADVPADALAVEGPIYDRASIRPGELEELSAAEPGDGPPEDLGAALLALLSSPTVASKRWIWEQYDHMIGLGTVIGPGADAAVIRLPGSEAAVALAVDGPGRYCVLDPYEGARLAVAEAARNVACTGARPVAVTNCLNFGNPEKPGVMWAFTETVRGLGDACEALGTPVTGGNVSFYNETEGRAVFPTPVIGMLGALESAADAVGMGLVGDGEALVLLGDTGGSDFGGSEYGKVMWGALGGRPPALDIDAEAALHRLLHEAARGHLLRSAHDCSAGGAGVALALAAFAGGRGFEVELPGDEPHRSLFAESPGRAVVSCSRDDLDALSDLAARHAVTAVRIGATGGAALDYGFVAVPLKVAEKAWSTGFTTSISTTID